MKVMYPGLASFPQKKIADKYHRNGIHGGMLWFDVEGGADAGRKLMTTLEPTSSASSKMANRPIVDEFGEFKT